MLNRKWKIVLERNYMGKVRVKTLGDEQEVEDKKKAKARALAKKIEAEKAKGQAAKEAEAQPAAAEQTTEKVETTPAPEEKKADKAKKQHPKGVTGTSVNKHSSKYMKAATQVDKTKKYSLKDALALLPELQRAKFDETVELHINTTEKGLSGSFVLPHGTGKKSRIAILNQSTDAKYVETVIKNIEAGQIDFDVLIATPDTMPKLAKVARVLGPRGLMPNPKNGTVTPKPEEVAKKFEGGQINYKTESKFPVLHLTVGKVSFGAEKLEANIKTALSAVKTKNIKNATLKSTMSPGIRLNV